MSVIPHAVAFVRSKIVCKTGFIEVDRLPNADFIFVLPNVIRPPIFQYSSSIFRYTNKLFIYLFCCVSIYLSIYPATYISICLSIYLSVRLSVYLSICPSIYLSYIRYISIYIITLMSKLFDGGKQTFTNRPGIRHRSLNKY